MSSRNDCLHPICRKGITMDIAQNILTIIKAALALAGINI
jgi:hypothetical protein